LCVDRIVEMLLNVVDLCVVDSDKEVAGFKCMERLELINRLFMLKMMVCFVKEINLLEVLPAIEFDEVVSVVVAEAEIITFLR